MRLIEQYPQVDPNAIFFRDIPNVLAVELDGQQEVFTLIAHLQAVATEPEISFGESLPYSGLGDLGVPRREAGRLALILADEMAKADGVIGPVSFRAPDRKAGQALRAAVAINDAQIERAKTRTPNYMDEIEIGIGKNFRVGDPELLDKQLYPCIDGRYSDDTLTTRHRTFEGDIIPRDDYSSYFDLPRKPLMEGILPVGRKGETHFNPTFDPLLELVQPTTPLGEMIIETSILERLGGGASSASPVDPLQGLEYRTAISGDEFAFPLLNEINKEKPRLDSED